MRIDLAFPSKYLKAADLQGKPVNVTMSHVREEQVSAKQSDPLQPVLYFVGKAKGLVLNKTNARAIATLYGWESDDWQGHKVQLFEIMTDYQGQATPGIRVRMATGQQAAPPPADDGWAGNDPLPPDDLPQAPPLRPAPAPRQHVAAPNGHVPQQPPRPAPRAAAAFDGDEIPF